MNSDSLKQQQELQKEFNDLVLSLSQQVSEKHLLEANKNIKKVNEDISNKLDRHISNLDLVSNKHSKDLEKVSKNYVVEVNKNLKKLNEDIPCSLEKQVLLIKDIKNSIDDSDNKISEEIRIQTENVIYKNHHIITNEFNNINNKIDLKFKANKSEIDELRSDSHKISKNLHSELDFKINRLEKIIIYNMILTILFTILALSFFVYFIVVR